MDGRSASHPGFQRQAPWPRPQGFPLCGPEMGLRIHMINQEPKTTLEIRCSKCPLLRVENLKYETHTCHSLLNGMEVTGGEGGWREDGKGQVYGDRRRPDFGHHILDHIQMLYYKAIRLKFT